MPLSVGAHYEVLSLLHVAHSKRGRGASANQNHDYQARRKTSGSAYYKGAMGRSGKWNKREWKVSLIVKGWERARALCTFFAPHRSDPADDAIRNPDFIYIYAANPDGETQRPYETVTPLAAWLNYPAKTPKFNINFSVGKDERDMVASAMSLDGHVLICWEHDNIMPNIIDAINTAVPIKDYSSIPPKWPNVLYLVWVLNLEEPRTIGVNTSKT
jgi:hypothetical protein